MLFEHVRNLLIGRPLPNESLQQEKLNVFWGLPIMSSDAISSVAYGVEEILWVLIVVGMLAYQNLFYAAVAIIVLLIILTTSYTQTINGYANGGGSYTVARENLGEIPSLLACAALVVGYTLTVAVSSTSGTAALTSAFPALYNYRVAITVALIILMTIGNLRGVRESARIFALPTYLFYASMLLMILVGIFKVLVLGYRPVTDYPLAQATQDMTLILFLRAFAAGCAGLTGVEAVANAIPNFQAPAQRTAKHVLWLLALFVFLIFGGSSFLATIFHAVPNDRVTVMSQIAMQVFGHNLFYFIVQATTMIILIMASNTAFAGLPMLLSLVARDGYMPRQFTTRGGRLSFSNGIIALSVLACCLVIVYKGNTHALVPLYAVGTFLSFVLSQLGMISHWFRTRERGWRHKAAINGFGALMTIVAVVIIGVSKFLEGAWISLILIVLIILFMKKTKRHYTSVAKELRLDPAMVPEETEMIKVSSHVIVIVGGLHRATLKALNYARAIAKEHNIVAFNVSIDEESGKKLKAKWKQCGIPFKLIVKYSPYRDLMGTLSKYIESEEHDSQPGDIITVVMPQFVVANRLQNIFHNQTGIAIRQRLLHDRHIAVVTVPFVLHEEKEEHPEPMGAGMEKI